MKSVKIADTCCLCYGASNAIKKTMETIETSKNVVMLNEILHNKNVMTRLGQKGAKVIDDLSDMKKEDVLIICAHGETKSTFDYLNKVGIRYVDCTCPNVKSVEKLVYEKDLLGYKIIIIGKHGFDGKEIHAEVKATMGWCDNPIVIEDESEIDLIDWSFDKYFLVVQTTFAKHLAEKFIVKIEKIMKDNNKIFEYKNTICNAQKQINLSSVELAKSVDCVIVVGGKNSNNSKELFNNVSQYVQAFFIENKEELMVLINEKVFDNYKNIGLTAGASTMMDDLIEMKNILVRI